MGKILVVPARETGRGGGHLVRSKRLVNELNALGKEALLYESSNDANLRELKIELVILDRFQTPPEELEKWKKLAPVIGIDEGGACREKFDFLIDILPNLEKVKPNISDIGLLPLPENILTQRTQRNAKNNLKILISFGLEDSAGLGLTVFDSLSKDESINLTFLNKNNQIPNLAEHLHEYDLVITHFGITAFEAIYAGIPFALINPTAYHEKLSKKAGFKTTKINKINSAISELPRLRANKFPTFSSKSLAKLIASFAPIINRACPVCGEAAPKRAIARFNDRTYRKCARCGIIFMDRIAPAPISYGKDYFFEEYKKQYGKTYLEDFPNLVAAAKRRLKIIMEIRDRGTGNGISDLRSPLPSLLDIGCAYGAFLSAAKDAGFEACGIDPSEDAIKYVKEKLGINAICSLFPAHCSLLSALCSFNTITLWYTIEHLQDCAPVLKEIRGLLAPNGILAFSTPSYSGVSGRKNLREFLKNSPADHFTIWSPSSCKKALALHGFKIKKIVNTGHHPERFPVFGKLACCKFSPIYWLLLAISKLFSLGDTFEVYAILT